MRTATAATVLVAGLTLSACGAPTAEPGATPTSRETPPPTPTAERSPVALTEEQAFAIGFSGDLSGLAVVDVTDGDVVRELRAGVGEGATSLDFVPGRHSVVFSRTVTAARSEVVEVPLDGGGQRVVTTGYAVDATDDGGRLAVARRTVVDDRDRVELEVRTFDGEVLATWTADADPGLPVVPGHLAWSNDGERLAFDIRFEDGVSAYLLDVADAPREGAIEQVARPLETREQEGAMTSRPFWLDDGGLGVIEACCVLPEFDTWRAVVIDPQTAAPQTTLFEVERGVGFVDVDRAGTRLLFLLTHEAMGAPRGADPGPDVLMRWRPGGAPKEVGTGFVSAAW